MNMDHPAIIVVEIENPTLSIKRWIGKHIPRANLKRYAWIGGEELWINGPYKECMQIKKTVRRLSRGKPKFTIISMWGSEGDLEDLPLHPRLPMHITPNR